MLYTMQDLYEVMYKDTADVKKINRRKFDEFNLLVTLNNLPPLYFPVVLNYFQENI